MPKSYYPPMHTAEHILNQTMLQMFTSERSFSNHLGKKKSKCDFYFNRNLTDVEINNLQKKVNEIINRNLEVKEHFLTKAEAEKEYSLSKLPKDSGDILKLKWFSETEFCCHCEECFLRQLASYVCGGWQSFESERSTLTDCHIQHKTLDSQ